MLLVNFITFVSYYTSARRLIKKIRTYIHTY